MLRDPEATFRRHWRILLTSLLLPLGLIAAFNFSVDPFHAYRVVPTPQLRAYRAQLESRIARGEILEHGGCEIAILGTSRAQIALDPSHPSWNRPACNLAITGAAIPEIEAVVRRVLEHREVREIFWTLDYMSFAANEAPHPELARSRFNARLDRFEYHAGLLLGSNALRASWKVLRDYRTQRRSRHDELGFMDPSLEIREPEYRKRFLWALEHDVESLARRSTFVYDPGAARSVAAVVEEARRRDVSVTLAVLPSHALHLESLARFGRWEEFERWKSDLVHALASASERPLPLWDCTAYTPQSTERVPAPGDRDTQMRWHWDSSHVKRSVGDEVIAQLRGGPAPALAQPCQKLDATSLRAVLASIRMGQERYRASAPADQIELLELARHNVRGIATAQKR
jgi:hypothetical protein